MQCIRVLVSCSALPGHGSSIAIVTVEDGGLLHVSDVVVDDGNVLPPCIAFTRVPPYDPIAPCSKMPLLWIAGLGLDSLWLSCTFSSSAPASLSHTRVTVARECFELNLGAHSSACAGDFVCNSSIRRIILLRASHQSGR
jgi:hypothetical protein